MALAEKWLAATFNRPGLDVVDHHTWVFLGDGCLMEGISHEACSLAGTLKLGKLIGVLRRQRHLDRRRSARLVHRRHAEALRGVRLARRAAASTATIRRRCRPRSPQAKAQTDRPTLICCKTIIGWGAPNKQGTEATHGAALGADEVAAARKPAGLAARAVRGPGRHPPRLGRARARCASAKPSGSERFNAYRAAFPELARSSSAA